MNLDLTSELIKLNADTQDPIPFFLDDVLVADARLFVGTRGAYSLETYRDIDLKYTSLYLVRNTQGFLEIRARTS